MSLLIDQVDPRELADYQNFLIRSKKQLEIKIATLKKRVRHDKLLYHTIDELEVWLEATNKELKKINRSKKNG